MSRRIPSRRFYGETMQALMLSIRLEAELRERRLAEQGWTARSVLGYKLPEWQRPEVWTDEQCAAFVESAWLGANIGAFMMNCAVERKLDQILLDGQQRMRALERYWNDEIAVAGDDGRLWLWGDLTESEQARFLRLPFPWVMTRYEEEAMLREAYNRHNFSGTPHARDQMAPDAAGALRSAAAGRVPA